MEILLVMPNQPGDKPDNSKRKYYYLPLGIMYISSYLKQKGYNPDCLNLNHYDADKLLKILNYKKYDYVCTGGIYYHYDTINNIIKVARETNKFTKIIVGGSIASAHPEYMFGMLMPDYFVIGDGEETLPNLITAIEHNEDIKTMPGIAFTENNRFFKTIPSSPISNLDDLPFPDYESFEFDYYIENIHLGDYSSFVSPAHVRMGQIIGGRGCRSKCTFCYHIEEKYRFRSVENIISEIKYLVDNYGINEIDMMDDVFSLKKDRVYEFCKKIKPLNIAWQCAFRVNIVDENLFMTLKDAGCHLISYGFESASNVVLKSMRKGISVEDIERVLPITRKEKITMQANFIFGDPAETLETAQETLNFYRKYKSYCINLSFVVPYPGSVLYFNSIEKGKIKNMLHFYKTGRDWGLKAINMTSLNESEFLYLMQLIMNEQYYKKIVRLKKIKKTLNNHILISLNCPICKEVIKDVSIPIPVSIMFRFLCPYCYQRFFLRHLDLENEKNLIKKQYKKIRVNLAFLIRKVVYYNPRIGIFTLSFILFLKKKLPHSSISKYLEKLFILRG